MVRAPELIGDTWFGTNGRHLSLSDLRGRIVLLDFWTLCCVNCHHVLAELREIEAEFAQVLTVVGVHSPKFEHEKDPATVLSAVERHKISHLVLNDPNMSTWKQYAVRAWPTLVLIDPLGNIAGTYSGEGHGHAISQMIRELVAKHDSDGSLVRGNDLYVPEVFEQTPYSQPGKAIRIGSNQLLISESGNHRLAIANIDEPNKPLSFIGSGDRGLSDGDFASASFNEPYGLLELPAELAAAVGFDVVVADTANHLLRGLNFTTSRVTTLAGTGAQWMQGEPTNGDGQKISLSTPWDLTLDGSRIVIAMAGDHRVWEFDLITNRVGVLAGTSNEGMIDGSFDQAWFAQSSGAATTSAGVWILDSETSSLRLLVDDRVSTVAGQGLFDFGHIDGTKDVALFQHPLGLAALPDESLVIADAYNGALRRFDPATGLVSTLARGLKEPSDVVVLAEVNQVLVVESGAGRLTKLPISTAENYSDKAMRTERPGIMLASGEVIVRVVFTAPPGQKLDDRYGPSTQLVIGTTPPALLISGGGTTSNLVRRLELADGFESAILHVSAKGASCDDTSDPEAHPLCHIHQQDWGIPVTFAPDGDREVTLYLAGS